MVPKVTELGSILILTACWRTRPDSWASWTYDRLEGEVGRDPVNRQPKIGQNDSSAATTAVRHGGKPVPHSLGIPLGLMEKIKSERTERTPQGPATSRRDQVKIPRNVSCGFLCC